MTDGRGRRTVILGAAALATTPAAAHGDPRAFMARAAWLRDEAARRGDQPFGAVVAKDFHIVGEAGSRVVIDNDPTAHAELTAIRDAARKLGTRDLSGCVLYSTFRPCRMCEAAAYWARIDRFVYGEGLIDGGAPRL